MTGNEFLVRPKTVVNATGVWAGAVDPSITLRPSRGTHLVFDADAFGGLTASLTVPVPGALGRYVFAFPAAHGRVYLGLTDENAPGPIPDVPVATDDEIAQACYFLASPAASHITMHDLRVDGGATLDS